MGRCSLASNRRSSKRSSASPEARGDRPLSRSATSLEVRSIDWNDGSLLESLFGPNGACGGCLCMHWRVPHGGAQWKAVQGEPNRQAFLAGIRHGTVHGAVAFRASSPVGWVSYGPRTEFPRLLTVRALRGTEQAGAWSVVCFYIPTRERGTGVATALLEAAKRFTRDSGATCLEGYPTVPQTVSPIPAAFAWTGVPAIFERAGFQDESGLGASRPIFRVWFRRP